MPDGTYNLLTSTGSVVEDPRITVSIENANPVGCDEWGLCSGSTSIQTYVSYAITRRHGVSLGELDDWYAENGHPDVTARCDFEDEPQHYVWSDSEDDYMQLE